MTYGYPLNLTTISQEGVLIRLLLGWHTFAISWPEIEAVQRIQHGLRFQLVEHSPVRVATPRYKPLIDAVVSICPDKYDPTVLPHNWWRV